jgi:hypothetical protein
MDPKERQKRYEQDYLKDLERLTTLETSRLIQDEMEQLKQIDIV